MSTFISGFGRTITFASALFFLLFSAPSLVAQTDTTDGGDDGEEFDDFNFDEIQPDDYRELDYVGFGGGYYGAYSLMNFDELNNLGGQFGLEPISGGMLMHGGGGFIGGVGLRNLRYGFFGFGGSKITEDSVTIGTVDYLRKLRFSSSVIAFQLDYAIFLPQEGLMLFPGIMIGRETSEIELSQTNAQSVGFDTLFTPSDFDGSASAGAELNRYSRIKRNSLHLRPVLNIEYAISQFIVFRLGGGYGFNFAGTWNHAAGTPVSNVPEEITADGADVHLGVFIGLFQK